MRIQLSWLTLPRGIAFMIMQVLVANITVVLLSWWDNNDLLLSKAIVWFRYIDSHQWFGKFRIIEKTASFSLPAITGIMIAVGMVMFLFPPVPGMPVYLAVGIVIPAKGHMLMGEWRAHQMSNIRFLLQTQYRRSFCRLDMVCSVLLRNWALLKIVFKCITASLIRRESLSLCPRQASRWD